MVAVLPKEKLISHAGDVIAGDDMAGNGAGEIFVVGRHGVAFAEEEMEKACEAFNGVVTIFGNDRMGVNVSDQKSFEEGVLRGDLLA